MVKVIMGDAGAGKTKDIIQLVRRAAEEETGSVICIEKGDGLRFDIPYDVRLVDASEYAFGSSDFLKGFVSGLCAGNFDITHIFIDGLFSLVEEQSFTEVEKLLDWCDRFSEKRSLRFTISVSGSAELATPEIRRYL